MADDVGAELRACAAILYHPRSTNESRQEAYTRCESGIANYSNPADIVTAAVTMLQDPSLPPEHHSFASSVLVQLVRGSRVTTDAMPYVGVATYLSGNRVHAVAVSGMANLLAECAAVAWPDVWVNMFDQLCPEDLPEHPELCVALEAVVTILVDAEPSTLPRGRFGRVRLSMQSASSTLLQRVVNAVGAIVTGTVTAFSASDYQGPPMASVLMQLLTVVEKVVSFSKPADWWTSYLDQLVTVLLTNDSAALRLQAANIFGVLTSASQADKAFAWHLDPRGMALLNSVVGLMETVASAADWETHEAILAALATLPPGDVAALAVPMFTTLTRVVLPIPSIKFAHMACDLLLAIGEVTPAGSISLDLVLEAMVSLRRISRKFVAHPVFGWEPASQFSADQFSTADEYEMEFAQLRASCGKVLQQFAQSAPAVAIKFLTDAVQQLPAASPSDPRNVHGYIAQQSPTYAEWEVTQFVTEHFHAAMSDVAALEDIKMCFETIFRVSSTIVDATLLPVLLNLLASLWVSAWADHWGESMSTLFHFISLEPADRTRQGGITNDPDLLSARRRAATLLVRACVEYGPFIVPFVDTLVQSVQQLLISHALLPSEVPMIYEAVAALSNSLSTDRQPDFVRQLISGHVEEFSSIAGALNPDLLAVLLTSDQRTDRQNRNALRESAGVLTAILKRCDPTSPVAINLATDLSPKYTALLIMFFQLAPHLPPRFKSMFDMDPAEKQAMATTGNTRPPSNVHNPIVSCAIGIRSNLYAGVAAMMRLLNAVPPVFNDLCGLLVPAEGQELMPAYLAKQICTHCLFEAVSAYPESALAVLPAVAAYIEAHSAVQRTDRDDVVESKLVAMIYRVAAGIIKRTLIESANNYMAVPAYHDCVAQFYLSVLRSGYEVRTATFDVLPLCTQPESPLAQTVFAHLVAAVRHPRVELTARRLVLDKTGDLYTKHFPRFADALHQVGLSTPEVEMLHMALMTASRPDAKRKKFGEFLCNWFGVPN